MPNNCVCGHPKEYHDSPGNRINGGCAGPAAGEEFDHLDQACDCQCRQYREVTDWPTSEGWWWCDKLGLVEARKQEVEFGFRYWLEGYGEDGFRDVFGRTYGPARFCKLTEPNPFGAQDAH